MANPLAKTRPVTDPYEIWRAGDWEWRVLKFYKTRENTLKDQYGRVFCQVVSPMTTTSGDLGDVYYIDIRHSASLVETNYPLT